MFPAYVLHNKSASAVKCVQDEYNELLYYKTGDYTHTHTHMHVNIGSSVYFWRL